MTVMDSWSYEVSNGPNQGCTERWKTFSLVTFSWRFFWKVFSLQTSFFRFICSTWRLSSVNAFNIVTFLSRIAQWIGRIVESNASKYFICSSSSSVTNEKTRRPMTSQGPLYRICEPRSLLHVVIIREKLSKFKSRGSRFFDFESIDKGSSSPKE